MPERVDVNLGDVQKTLFLPLWGRAEESRKPRPLLADEAALDIMARVDFDFSPLTNHIDALTQLGWIKRSLLYDRVVTDFLTRYPEGTIVNIGCGLDTTFERTDNGVLKWYDLDLPDVIALRSSFLKETERRRFLATSFLDNDWLEAIEVGDNVLFMAAGVFYYFEEPQIKAFIVRLIDRFPGSEIVFDASSPLGVRICNKRVVDRSGLGERSHLVWGLKRTGDVATWDSRIRIVGTYCYYRKQVSGLRSKLMGMLADLIRIQYMIHLRLGDVEPISPIGAQADVAVPQRGAQVAEPDPG
jgi:O-methyltransferase involved in polyketide biosynthesis